MKSIAAIFLSAVIILQSFGSLILVAGYELNKNYITQAFCENKSKPMLHCNGKCHLKKQLKEDENKGQSPVNSTKEKQETTQFSQDKSEFSFTPASSLAFYHPLYKEINLQEVSFSFFHPPAC